LALISLLDSGQCPGTVLTYRCQTADNVWERSLYKEHTHTHITWIRKIMTKTVGSGTSNKYTNIQIYSVQYYKHFTKTVL